MTHRIRPNLSSAIYLSVACSIVLSGANGFHAKEVVMTTLPAVALLLFAVRQSSDYLSYPNGMVATAMIVLLLLAVGYEILALWQLYLSAYNGDVSLGFVAAAVLIPTLYLRRKTPLAQSSNFLLILLALVMLLMLISVTPQLRVTNLSTSVGSVKLLGRAACYDTAITPELLIAAMLPFKAKPNELKKRENATVTKAVLLLCLGRAVIYLLLELFYGNAVIWRTDAFHTVTASGTISMFKRMEWLQLLLWTLAVSVKIALFFYAAWGVLKEWSKQFVSSEQSTGIPMADWSVMAFLTVILVTIMKDFDFETLQSCMMFAVWGVWLLTTIGGFIKCTLFTKKYGA